MDLITWQPGMTLANIEKLIILKALRFFHGNKTQTARSLGIAIRTLDDRLKTYEENELKAKELVEAEVEKRKAVESSAKAAYDERVERFRAKEEKNSKERAKRYDEQLQRETKDYSEIIQHDHKAEAGLHTESTSKTTEKHGMPLPEQKEVQAMLPQHNSKNNKRRSGS